LGEPPSSPERIPLSAGVRQAIEAGSQATEGQPLSSAAILAALMLVQEPAATRTAVAGGLIPRDVLGAIAGLSRIGELDPVAGRVAGADATDAPSEGDVHIGTSIVRGDDEFADAVAHAEPSVGWEAPDREAALSMRQFQLAAASALCVVLVALAIAAVAAAATGGRGWWLLLLAPLAGVGTPTTGTWAYLPVAVLFFWLQMPAVAWLLLATVPPDVMVGALMRLQRELSQNVSAPRHAGELRIRPRHVAGALLHGLGRGR
jgi:hypothetical protein